MTDQPKTALEQFLATAERVKSLLSAAEEARKLPERRPSIVKSVNIETPTWTIPESQKIAIEAAKTVRDALVDRYRAAGERERDTKLCALAAELTAIRSVLPNLAARAAIELGVTSRALFAEAQEGSA